jgi:xylitol oxidase
LPSTGKELQSEYFLDLKHAEEAFMALESLATLLIPVLFITEIRLIAADSMWLSGSFDRTTVAFHFTWKQVPAVSEAVQAVEQVLAPFSARPHWGKVFTPRGQEEWAALYPRWREFVQLVAEMDPEGKFSNTFTSDLFSAT